LWAETSPLLEARTDLGAIFPVIVRSNFILESLERSSAFDGEIAITIKKAINRERIRTRLI